MPELTAERASILLDYDPETGKILWNVDRTKKALKGSIAGAIGKNGYRYIGIDGKKYPAHRVAWLLYYGSWPEGNLDHINRNSLDQRIKNLRIASQSQNMMNRETWKIPKTGFRGVHKHGDRYRATITHKGKLIVIGSFEELETAITARRKAAEDLFGEFVP